MPKVSERQTTISETELLLKRLVIDDEDDTVEFEDIVDLQSTILSSRYLNLRECVKKNRSMNEMLWTYSDFDFKQAVRMQKRSFLKLLEKIEGHQVFENNSRNPQAAVWIQLMVVLQLVGLDGTGASVGRNARMAGFSHGSVIKFKDRVFAALLVCRSTAITWPDSDERKVRNTY
jgi:hypothetical protein